MNLIKKQVKTDKYNTNYYKDLYVSPDYSSKFSYGDFGSIYKELADMITLSTKDRVVDFGCGNGELSFCLSRKYGNSIIGIDYSNDAISIAKDNLNSFKKNNPKASITFINSNNNKLPNVEGITAVYFCDVLEHMYTGEIESVMKTVKMWNKKNEIKIIVHTDNDLFLRFIRPLIDLIAVLFGVSCVKGIKKRNRWENERHVNLTNPVKLRRYMKKFGFREVVLRYPKASKSRVKNQLGNLAKIPGFEMIVHCCIIFLKPLSPSFYAVYEYEK